MVVLTGALAVVLLGLALQLCLTWLRAPSLLVSADRLRYEGVGAVVELAWDALVTVEQVDRTTRWACVAVLARTGASTPWHWRPPADRAARRPGA